MQTPTRDHRLHLWSNHAALAQRVVNEYCFRQDLKEDALQETKLALWEASASWTESMEETFTHYAWLVMRRKLLNYLTEKATERPRLSNSDREVMYKINDHIRAGQMITSHLISSLSDEHNVSIFRITQVISYWYVASIRVSAAAFTEFEEACSKDDLEDAHQEQIQLSFLDEALKSLPERDRNIIRCRYLSDPLSTLKELASQYGISIERVRQIEKRAINKLKELLSEKEA